MRKVISVYLPTWSIDRARRRWGRGGEGRGSDGAAEPRSDGGGGAGTSERAGTPGPRCAAARGLGGGRRDGGGKRAACASFPSSLRRFVAPSLLLLVAETRGRLVVRRCCEEASAGGVCEGMALAHARALVGERELRIGEYEPGRDAAALRALAHWALRFSPVVQVDDTAGDEAEPDGLLIDVTGCDRLYGGAERAAELVAEAVARLGVSVRTAVGPTVGAAWALARYGGGSDGGGIVGTPGPRCAAARGLGGGGSKGGDQSEKRCRSDGATERRSDGGKEAHASRCSPSSLRRFVAPSLSSLLSPLPIHALRLAPDDADGLNEVGIDTVGELFAVPRRELFERFGASVLKRIDQATGRVAEPLAPVRPVEAARVERAFAGPVTQVEAIEITVRELLRELAAELRRRGEGARRIVLECERYEAADTRQAVTLAGPCAEAGHLSALFGPRVERLHLGHGIERVALVADRVERLRQRQAARWGVGGDGAGAGDGAALARWIDTMVARLGRARVCAMEATESHAPHDVFHRRPVDAEADAPAGGGGGRGLVRAAALVEADRPTVLHERPEAVEVVTLNPDGPLVRLTRGGVEHRIARTIGPERIAGRWWRSPDPSRPTPQRDYFKVQDEAGRWLWVYREVGGRRRWWCHGEWA